MEPSRTFISYSKVDAEFALKLASQLRSEGIGIWIDQLDIAPGARWDRAIEAAMTAADRILVVLSPTSTTSENVQDEIGLAFDTGKQIIPVLCKPCEVPMRLRRLQHIDFAQDYDRAFERLLAAARLPAASAAGRSAGAPGSAASTAPVPNSAAHSALMPHAGARAAEVPHAAAHAASVPNSPGNVFSPRNIGIGVVLLALVIGTIVKLSGRGSSPAEATEQAPAQAVAEKPQCDQEGSLRSVGGEVQTLKITNNLANAVSLYWVSFEGALQKRGSIEPNVTRKQDTFEGHYWVIKDILGQCLKVVRAPAAVTLP